MYNLPEILNRDEIIKELEIYRDQDEIKCLYDVPITKELTTSIVPEVAPIIVPLAPASIALPVVAPIIQSEKDKLESEVTRTRNKLLEIYIKGIEYYENKKLLMVIDEGKNPIDLAPILAQKTIDQNQSVLDNAIKNKKSNKILRDYRLELQKSKERQQQYFRTKDKYYEERNRVIQELLDNTPNDPSIKEGLDIAVKEAIAASKKLKKYIQEGGARRYKLLGFPII